MKPSQLVPFLVDAINAKLPLMLVGAPGVGKSDLVALAAKLAGAKLVLIHASVADPTDPKGLPALVDGKAEFLPYGDLRQLMNAKKTTICFLDDLGQAPPAVQAAYMQLILGRRINGHRVSDRVVFIAATNRKQDKAGVTGILEPVKSRFCSIVQLEADLNDWCRWALENGLPTELIAFIRFRPDLLHDFKPTASMTNSPSPRTAHNVGKLMAMGVKPELELEAYAGAAGEGFAGEFLAFVKIYRGLPSAESVLMNVDKAKIPKDIATLTALCGSLAARASEQTADRLFRFAGRLPKEVDIMLIRDCVAVCKDIEQTRVFINWAVENQNILL